MSRQPFLDSLPDDELLRRLTTLMERTRHLESEVVAHLAEVDERRLYLGEGCSSMHAYSTEVLHLSEAEAYLRIAVARASRRFPVLLEMLGDGRLHLSGIAKLAPHLCEENAEALLARAVHQSKREIEKLVVEISPKPDVPSRIRKLPSPRRPFEGRSGELSPDETPFEEEQLSPGAAESVDPVELVRPAVVEPLSPSRYKVELTVSAELRDKLERARGLLRHKLPNSSNDLAAVVDEAVTLLLDKLEGRRFGKTRAPRKTLDDSDTSAPSRHIPAAVKRAVFERDGGRCTFVGAKGRRCSCTDPGQLEYHHIRPYGRGGDHDPDGIELRCRAHNAYQAELDYGTEMIALAKGSRKSGSSRASEAAWTARYGKGKDDARGPLLEWRGQAKAGKKWAAKDPRPISPVVLGARGGLHSRIRRRRVAIAWRRISSNADLRFLLRFRLTVARPTIADAYPMMGRSSPR